MRQSKHVRIVKEERGYFKVRLGFIQITEDIEAAVLVPVFPWVQTQLQEGLDRELVAAFDW